MRISKWGTQGISILCDREDGKKGKILLKFSDLEVFSCPQCKGSGETKRRISPFGKLNPPIPLFRKEACSLCCGFGILIRKKG